MDDYVKRHPCFYFEELRIEIGANFPYTTNLSDASNCRALRYDLDLIRKKKMTKRARESVPVEQVGFAARLLPFYSGRAQLVFVDETSKDGQSVMRKPGRSRRNEPAVASLFFLRGKRVSVLAATDINGFVAWDYVEDTFMRKRFHEVFCTRILPHLNLWPFPRSINILNNAKIHMYQEFQDMIHTTGAFLFSCHRTHLI